MTSSLPGGATTICSVSECQEQYEAMRHQALQGRNEEAPGCKNNEAAFIERLGLAAWIERGPESSVPTEAPPTEPQQAKNAHNQLVIILTDFVVSGPKGMGYG